MRLRRADRGGKEMIASEVQLCSTCGHPVKEKEDGSWRHTNSIDGHVFTTKACQQCIAEGRDCRNAQPHNMEVSVTGTAGEVALPRAPKVKEEHYIICKICGIYAKSQAALMSHYREKHPVDKKELIRLYREGKSIEEMAAILERTPATIRYHLLKLPEYYVNRYVCRCHRGKIADGNCQDGIYLSSSHS